MSSLKLSKASKKTKRKNGPDFLCVGMPKSGTTWLYHQLKRIPGYAMPPFKELHYFDLPPASRRMNFARQIDLAPGIASQRTLEFRDRALSANSLAEYNALFRFAGRRISGDMTPAYSVLPVGKIARIHREMPELSVLMAVRDPVERIWSAIRSLVLSGRLSVNQTKHWVPLRDVLETSGFSSLSMTSTTLRHWRYYFDVHLVVFDDIVADPATCLQQVDGFLTGKRAKPIRAVNVPHNAGVSMPLAKPIAKKLIEFMEADLRDCAELIGPPAEVWLKRHL